MYLMIKNRGIADPLAITLLGASTTRYTSTAGTIGQFGSGTKYAIAQFLRNGINPVIVSDHLKMYFYSKPVEVGGRSLNRVCVKYSGSKNSNEDLGFATEFGILDWKVLGNGFREFVSNAIDGATLSGGSYRDVEISVKESPRVKDGYTSVFIPLTPEIQDCWNSINTTFLHFTKPHLLKENLLPKQHADGKVRVYKRGVLVRREVGESIYDYNLPDLPLNESRNANSWDIKSAVAKALGKAKPGQVAAILNAQIEGKDIWEGRLDTNYLYDEYEDEKERAKKAEVFKAAFQTLAGDSGIITQGVKHITEVVERKGFKPKKVSPSWFAALERYGLPTENKVLEGLEKEGIPESPATADMLKALDKVWGLISDLDMLGGKEKPPVKAFSPVMDALAQVFGRYKDGTVFIHTDLGTMSPLLLKVMMEEVVHHITGATDMSRDFQDWLFRLIINMWEKEEKEFQYVG